MILNKEQISLAYQKGQDVWAYSFIIANKKSGRKVSHLPPTCGKIININNIYLYFVPYNDKGKLLMSKRRRLDHDYGRNDLDVTICDDYETAKEEYLQLVDIEIERLYNQLSELNKLKEWIK